MGSPDCISSWARSCEHHRAAVMLPLVERFDSAVSRCKQASVWYGRGKDSADFHQTDLSQVHDRRLIVEKSAGKNHPCEPPDRARGGTCEPHDPDSGWMGRLRYCHFAPQVHHLQTCTSLIRFFRFSPEYHEWDDGEYEKSWPACS